MIKSIFYFLVLLTVSFHSKAICADPITVERSKIDCAPQFQQVLSKILQLPEARELIASVLKEGPIRILPNRTRATHFGALWGINERQILINRPDLCTEGDLIGSIIFELHNALANRELDHYDNLAEAGRIDRESYVEAIEYIEFRNSHNASSMVDKGIQQGLFPSDAHLPIYPTFDEHFRIQKMGGHSAWIARNYDMIAPR